MGLERCPIKNGGRKWTGDETKTSYFMKIWSGNVNREMTRHGRNQTASAVYSYQEKKKDSSELVNL